MGMIRSDGELDRRARRAMEEMGASRRYVEREGRVMVMTLCAIARRNGMSLSDALLVIEGERPRGGEWAYVDARCIYGMLDRQMEMAGIGFRRICMENGWDYSDMKKDRRRARRGEKQTLTLWKLNRMTRVLGMGMGDFARMCEEEVLIGETNRPLSAKGDE